MDLLNDANQEDQIQIDENKDYYAELTGPGGKFDRSKFASEADMHKAMAKSNFHGSAYIEHRNKMDDELRKDYLRLREEHQTGLQLKDLLDQLKNPKQDDNAMNQGVPNQQAVVDPKTIEEIVQQKLAQSKQNDREEANFRNVTDKLMEHYGPNYQNALKQQIDSLGLDKDFVNDLARKHPQVLFKTLGIGERRQENFQAPPQSSSRTDKFSPNANKRTWSYYQDLRKKDPVAYNSPKIKDQMFKDALALGDAFEDGDWNALGH